MCHPVNFRASATFDGYDHHCGARADYLAMYESNPVHPGRFGPRHLFTLRLALCIASYRQGLASA